MVFGGGGGVEGLDLLVPKSYIFTFIIVQYKIDENEEYSFSYCVSASWFQSSIRVFFHLLSDTKGGAKKSRLPKTG